MIDREEDEDRLKTIETDKIKHKETEKSSSSSVEIESLEDHLRLKGLELFLCIDGGGTKTKVTISSSSSKSSKSSENENSIDNERSVNILSTSSYTSSNYTDLGIRSATDSIGRVTLRALKDLPPHLSHLIRNHPTSNWQPILRETQRNGDKTLKKRIRAPFSRIWAGLSGVDSWRDVIIMREELSILFGFDLAPEDGPNGSEKAPTIEVTNDCDLLSGPIEDRFRCSSTSRAQEQDQRVCRGGIVLIAGTGSIVTAYGPSKDPEVDLDGDPRKTTSRSIRPIGRLGGYGYLIGDEGSSFDVGKETVKEILNWLDHGRRRPRRGFEGAHNEPKTNGDDDYRPEENDDDVGGSNLLRDVLDHFKISDPEDLLASVYKLNEGTRSDHERKLRLAQVSEIVMRNAFVKDRSEKKNSEENHLEGKRSGEDQQNNRFAMRMMRSSIEKLNDQLVRLMEIQGFDRAEDLVLCLGGGMFGRFDEFRELLIDRFVQITGSKFGWVEVVHEPDRVGALSLANR